MNQPISIKFNMDTWIWFFQKYSNFQINSFSGYWDIKNLSRVALGVGVSVDNEHYQISMNEISVQGQSNHIIPYNYKM